MPFICVFTNIVSNLQQLYRLAAAAEVTKCDFTTIASWQ